ncbi:MAG TPA: neutral zinc metallopeptidase [Rhizomicrobium sp.]|nr:neutral zinc metallopeptidase [Rhizomicrobium sp.]
MRLDDLRPTENVDDRRGQGGGFGGGGFGGRHIAIGGGGLGLVAFIVIALLANGGDVGGLLNQMTSDQGGGLPYGPGQTQSQPASQEDQAAFEFSRKIIGSTEDVWTQILAKRGIQYQPATFTPFTQYTQTGCGEGEAVMGPFYCPNDHRVYIDLAFFNELATRFGAPGQFAQAYVLAHEIGHNVQNILGTMDKASGLSGGRSSGATGSSVRLELQADCYAGVWAYNANRQFHILETGDVEQGLAAATAVGDDTLQKETEGRVAPDTFTHGTSEQRVRWFRRGLSTGDMDQCDTFGARTL